MAQHSAGQALVEGLAGLGVRHFFGVPGESFLEVLDTAECDKRTRLVSTRHESGAAFMAEASAKLTGVPAVAMATRAVGAANLSIGVHTALHDSTPLIALVGQVDQRLQGREGFQEIDLQAFYRPITKWTAALRNPDHARELAYRAYVTATSGRPGPVLIELPADVLAETREWAEGSVPRLAEVHAVPGADTVHEIAARLAAAERPVVIAGAGAQAARTELIRLAAQYDLGVYSAFRRQDVFPNDHERYLGHLTLGTSPRVLAALREADLVLVLGCRLSEVTSQTFTVPTKDAVVIHVDIDARSMGVGSVPTLGVPADVRATVQALLAQDHAQRPLRDWSGAHDTYWQESTTPPAPNTPAIHPSEVIAAMSRALPPDCLVASDAGNFSIFLHRYWRYNHPHTQLAPTSGAMGYGVPAAIAAKLTAPERTVVGVCGDGGFLMTGQEIETAVRNDAPVTIIVLRNGMYGTIAMHQLRGFGRTAGTDIGDVDVAAYAASLGARSFTVRERSELESTIRDAVSTGYPTVVDVLVDSDVLTPSATLSSLRDAR